MKNCRKLLFVTLFTALVFLSGCSMALTGRATVETQAFTPKKKYALVTISAAKEFNGEQGFSQMFTKNEDIKGLNTQPVIDQLVPVIRAKLAKTGYFTSIPMKSIVYNRSYKRLAEDERVQKVAFFKNELNVAKGYKYFSDPKKLGQLARDLNVDGVICVTMQFSVDTMKSGVYVGFVTVGKKEYAASATISAIAYDTAGKVLWKDSTMKQAEPGDKKAIIVFDSTDITATKFKKMHPSAVLIGGYAVDVLVQRFKDTMEGKGTSIFQSVKDDGSKKATKTKS